MSTPERDPVERLLRQADPRPLPPPAETEAVRDALREEWRTVVAARKTRRWRRVGIAASFVVAAIFIAVTQLPNPQPPAVVAAIDKSVGAIYVLGERSELVALDSTTAILGGQIVETRADAALGLAWGSGGSLRLDENTRVEFISEESVALRRGRVYFDSAGEDDAILRVETGQGSLRHVGTQYMAAVDGERLVVSVREGEVRIDGRYYDETAVAGKQVALVGSARPTILDVAPTSGAWTWTERVALGVDLDRPTADEFLDWFERETGFDIVYESSSAEAEAKGPESKLNAPVELEPRSELRIRMSAAGLEYELDDEAGVLRVRLPRDGER